MVAVSIELPELAGLVALRFAAVCFGKGGDGSAVPPGLVWEEAVPATARPFSSALHSVALGEEPAMP
jgi:hypothetical protein